ncbi:MAG TPA: hypothetical protein VJS68_02670 [Thermoplasmata archaeon]|nr:hypothetical protein [Thermoplasmata archaeon]
MRELPGLGPDWPDPLVAAPAFCAVAGLLAVRWPFFVNVTEVLAALTLAALVGRWTHRELPRPIPSGAFPLGFALAGGWLFLLFGTGPEGILRGPVLALVTALVAIRFRTVPASAGCDK